jgi:hypothetical protein
MKVHRSLTLSLLGNVGLLTTVVVLASRSPHAAQREAASRAVPTPAPQATAAPFQWSQIESEDYARYVANLRTIGCPEPTIEAIVSSELAGVFARERAELQQRESPRPADPAPPPAAGLPIKQKLQDLEREQKSFLTQLLPSLPASSAERADAIVQPTSPSASAVDSPAPMAQRALGNEIAANGTGAVAATSDLTDPSAVQSSGENRTRQVSNADGPAFAPGDPSAKRPARRELFTVEQQRYRALWGWSGFYYEPAPNR